MYFYTNDDNFILVEEADPRINWKKIWKKAKPILIEVGKIAGGAAIAGALGGGK